MSTAVAPRHPSLGADWTQRNLDVRWSGEQASNNGAGQLASGDGKHWSRDGLLTPPTTARMTGVTYNAHYPAESTSQAYPPPRPPLLDVVNGNIPTFRRDSLDQYVGLSRGQSSSLGPALDNSRDWDLAMHKNTENSIASHLQIPESVNKSKGSLAEFASEITCLFWFETADTLRFAEDIPNISYISRGLLPDSVPSTGFRKWVTTILSTTQVGKNVILLALMFIYRLKKFDPVVSGKRGSEFRLLTIALMLGNKFLDDNTYTNKTWAEVSGIPVTEIHIMEVEFLSNMRYNLYVSEGEWADWKVKLGKFGAYYEQALRLSQAAESRPALPVTPTFQSFPQRLPSPPSTHHSTSPLANTHNAANYSTLPNPTTTVPHLSRSPVRHYRNPVLEHLERKRSMDFTNEQLPPAKRMYQPSSNNSPSSAVPTPAISAPTPGSQSALTPSLAGSAFSFPDEAKNAGSRVPRLPFPKIQTTNPAANGQLAPISFPAPRAMSTVYPSSTAPYSQPVTPISALPPSDPSLYQHPIPNLGHHSRDQSSHFSSAQGSPSYSVVTPTRAGLSPSYFLHHRSSPYRPVRGVNTLLIPPPSASMANLPRNIPLEQIHYQPLSKTTQPPRIGPLPYMQTDPWQQSNATTPIALQQYTFRG